MLSLFTAYFAHQFECSFILRLPSSLLVAAPVLKLTTLERKTSTCWSKSMTLPSNSIFPTFASRGSATLSCTPSRLDFWRLYSVGGVLLAPTYTFFCRTTVGSKDASCNGTKF